MQAKYHVTKLIEFLSTKFRSWKILGGTLNYQKF